MGSFSWLKADRLTKRANVYYGCPFKFLIPKEYGGGFILDHYQDYGHLGRKEEGGSRYDMYELLAFWNHEAIIYDGKTVGENLLWKGKNDGVPMPFMKEVDEFTDDNRGQGINIGCYDRDIVKLKYPLKLTSFKNKQTYEECDGISLGDPHQGFYSVTWDQIDRDNILSRESNLR